MRPATMNYTSVLGGGSRIGLAGLGGELGRLLDDSLAAIGGGFGGGWVPPVDLVEDEDNLVATVELPGLRKDDIKVSVEDGWLTVSGERRRDDKHNQVESHLSERFYGRFGRVLLLPKPVKVDAVKAVYRDGLLIITMPKTEEAKPKQIEVRMG